MLFTAAGARIHQRLILSRNRRRLPVQKGSRRHAGLAAEGEVVRRRWRMPRPVRCSIGLHRAAATQPDRKAQSGARRAVEASELPRAVNAGTMRWLRQPLQGLRAICPSAAGLLKRY
jgi:HD-like signal output (HDOD) protein